MIHSLTFKSMKTAYNLGLFGALEISLKRLAFAQLRMKEWMFRV